MLHPRLTRAFRALERFSRIDLRYSLSGGFFLTLTQVTSAVSGLVLTVAFANLLPVETYGTYRYVLAVYGLLTIASLPGADTAVLQSVSLGYDSAFRTGILAKLRWSILGTIASFLYAGYLYLSGDTLMGHTFLLVGVALPFMEAFSLYTGVLNAKRAFKTWAVFEIATQAVSLAGLIYAVSHTEHIILIMAAYFVPYILCRVAATVYVSQYYIAPSPKDPGVLSYGRSMTLFQVISRLMASLDQIVLYQFLGPVYVAIFSLATAVPNRIQSVLRITGTLAFPKFAKQTGAEIAQSLPRKMFLFACGILGICILYVLGAPYLFAYVFPNYLPSLLYSQVAVFYTLSAITYPFGSYLMAHKKIRKNYVMAIAGFTTKVACLSAFVPFIGIWGAIIGILATALVTILMVAWFIVRERNANTDTLSNDQSRAALAQ